MRTLKKKRLKQKLINLSKIFIRNVKITFKTHKLQKKKYKTIFKFRKITTTIRTNRKTEPPRLINHHPRQPSPVPTNYSNVPLEPIGSSPVDGFNPSESQRAGSQEGNRGLAVDGFINNREERPLIR